VRRLLKITAILVIGILTARPVLSSLACTVRMVASCAPHCPMEMSAMGAECPMSGMIGTPQNCCSLNVVVAVLPRAAQPKTKAALLSLVPAALGAASVSAQPFTTPVSSSPRASSPPRYVVNRVFRI
jgi:hypothetical protein